LGARASPGQWPAGQISERVTKEVRYNRENQGAIVHDQAGRVTPTDRTRLRRRKLRAGDDALAVASARRAAAVAEDARSLCPRRSSVPDLSRGALGQTRHAEGICRA